MKNKINVWLPYLLCMALAGGCFALDLSWELGVAGGIPYLTLFFAGLWFQNRRAIIFAAIVGSILTITGYFFIAHRGRIVESFHQPLPYPVCHLADCRPFSFSPATGKKSCSFPTIFWMPSATPNQNLLRKLIPWYSLRSFWKKPFP